MQILKQNKATLNDMGNSMDLLGESNEAHIKMQAAMLMFCSTRSRMPRVVVFKSFLTPVGPNQAQGRNPLRPEYS